MLKKILKITGITLTILLLLAFLLPIIFKNQILNLVKTEINKSLEAKVDFEDVTLSFFRHFPSVSISVKSLSVVGTNEFAADTLVSAQSIDVAANLWSVIRGKNIKVSGLYLNSPRIHALVNKEGKANWDIAKATGNAPETADSAASGFQLNLKKYKISNGYLLYRDESAGINTELTNFDHEGKGDFTEDIFTLSTNTAVTEANFSYDNIPYLIRTKTDIGADIKIDNKTSTYTINTDDIRLNNLKMALNGFIQLVNDSTYKMDFKFKTPANDFKDILSLIPAVYKNDFDKLKAGGQASFDGFVKGEYSPSTLPAYDVHAEITNGFFQYPDLPKKVDNIQLKLRASNPDGIADHAVIDISSAHLQVGNDPFDFHFIFKNPETIKYLDAAAKGRLDLSEISSFIKLQNGTRLKGSVLADVYARGNLSALEKQQGPFAAGGFLDIRDLFYSSKDFPQPIQNANMKVLLQNTGGIADQTEVAVTAAHVELGKDPFDFSLKLNKPVSTMEFSGNAKGRFTLDNLKQFVRLESGTDISGIVIGDLMFSGNKTAIDKSDYSKITTTGTIDLRNIKYKSKEYPGGVTISTSTINLTPAKFTLRNTQVAYLNSNFSVDGELNNLIGYALKNQTLKGEVNVRADRINLNDWMGSETTTSSESSSIHPFVVPANVDLTVQAKASEVQYDKVDYRNVDGILRVSDQAIKLEKVKTEALDGKIEMTGSYSTKASIQQPAIALNYNIQDLNVQKAFLAFNSVQKLMPIAQFLDGKLSSQLSMTGNLNGQMMPELNSLSGNGSLLLLKGILKKFAPLEKLANALQIDDLKEISVKDIKNYIEFANGRVLVKPFLVKVKDIEMQIGGTHGFDQSLNYIIQMNIPRKYFGSQGNALVNQLAAQASGKGIPVNLGETVHLTVRMGGTMNNLTMKTDLKEIAGDATTELKQQAVDFAKAKVDSTKTAVKDSLNSVKKQLVSEVKQDLTKQLLQPKDSSGSRISVDSSKKKAETMLRNQLNGLFKKKKNTSDTTHKQ